jgi:hypothetical protein
MKRRFARFWPLLFASSIATWLGIAAPLVNTGAFCVIVLIGSLGAVLGEIWKKMDAYEKRISELEEKLERQHVEQPASERTAALKNNAPRDSYFSPR